MLLFLSVISDVDTPQTKCPFIDETLFPLIAKGDMVAFESLYRQSEGAVYSFVLSILRDPDVTCDIMQDTYIKIRAAAHLYKPQGKPLAWIFTIARNLCYNSKRKKTALSFEDFDSQNNSYFSYIDDSEDRLILTETLKILKESERKVILLHLVSGLSHKEIASSLDQPISTVLSRYNRAIKKLRKHLMQQEVFCEWKIK